MRRYVPFGSVNPMVEVVEDSRVKSVIAQAVPVGRPDSVKVMG